MDPEQEERRPEPSKSRKAAQDKAVETGLKTAKVAQPEAAPFIEAAEVAYKHRDKIGKIIKWAIAGFVAIVFLFIAGVALIFVVLFGDSASGSCTSGDTNLVGSDNAQKAYNFFLAKGLQDFQSAGILGNLKQESGVDPTAQEDGSSSPNPKNGVGFGIAQWTFTSRQQPLVALAEQKGVAPTDLGVQLEYLWQEFTTDYAGVLERLKSSTTIEDAVNIFVGPNNVHGTPVSPTTEVARSGGFENPGKPNMANRLKYANEVLAQNGGGAPPEDLGGCSTEIPSGTSQELAQQILDSPNVNTSGRLVDTDLQATVSGQPGSAGAPLDEKLLQTLVALAKKYTFTITALESGGTGHTATSNHYKGLAADIVPSGSTTYDQINSFLYQNRATFHLDELIYEPMPDGTTTLKHGAAFTYSRGVLDIHHNHTHVSVE